MRLPTFGKPRIISCAELHNRYVGLPRSCLDDVVQLPIDHHVELALQDLRVEGVPLPPNTGFEGELRGHQVKSLNALALHDIGVLAADDRLWQNGRRRRASRPPGTEHPYLGSSPGTAFAVGSASEGVPEHRPEDIGVIGGGRRKPTGIIDVALIQSLVRGGEADDLVANLRPSRCRRMPSSFRVELRVGRQTIKSKIYPRSFRNHRQKGRSPPDHLHAVWAGALSREREDPGCRGRP